MKRITFIGALLAAVILPVLVYAQSGVNSRPIQRTTGGQAYEFGGTSRDSMNYPPEGSRSFSEDFRAEVDLEVDTNPILACSGLDIRDSIKGMFDMSSLADDVKNYLTSLLAKQALTLVYSNPQIAGVLDGLKAFGNSRFQLAQQSCEAIEGEVSAEARFYRQQAFNNCMAKHNDTYKCSVETGNYVEGLREFVNSTEARINNSVHNWTSRINIAQGPSFQSRICANLNGYCSDPMARAQAEQSQVIIPDSRANPNGAANVSPPGLSPEQVYNEALAGAQESHGIYMGAMVGVASAYRGNINAAIRDIEVIADERRQAYRQAASGSRVGIPNDVTIPNFDRRGAQTMFISAERKATARLALDVESQMRRAGFNTFTAGYHPDIGSGYVGTHGPESAHYYGLGVDFNCNGAAGGERGCLQQAQSMMANSGCWTDIEEAGEGHSTGLHLHIQCDGPRGPQYDVRNPFANAIQYVQQLQAGFEPVAAATNPDERREALRTALEKVPLIPEDVCLYDLDKKGGLDDIRNVTDIFGLSLAVNQLAERGRRESDSGTGGATGGGASDEGAAGLASSFAAKVQELNITIGRLSVCYMVDNIDKSNLMKTQYLSQGEAFDYIRSLSLATAGQAALTLYDGVIYQVSMSAIMATSAPDAPPAIQLAFAASIELLKNMRDSIKGILERQDSLATRQRSLDIYLQRQQNRGAIDAAERSRARSTNAGRGAN